MAKARERWRGGRGGWSAGGWGFGRGEGEKRCELRPGRFEGMRWWEVVQDLERGDEMWMRLFDSGAWVCGRTISWM